MLKIGISDLYNEIKFDFDNSLISDTNCIITNIKSTHENPFWNSWYNDIHDMHKFYKFHDIVKNFTIDEHYELLNFRADFLQEELTELRNAINTKDAEEVVDACIDLIVVAIGTLDLLNVDMNKAWHEVLKANMNKKVGVKETRKQSGKFPDLIKDESWVKPDHSNNHGVLKEKKDI